ncbi:MAG: hypothetical protein MJZ27_07220 [Bacteroidales bacterium]|nr:hypothetical protein [Bacteroidales bacterium]
MSKNIFLCAGMALIAVLAVACAGGNSSNQAQAEGVLAAVDQELDSLCATPLLQDTDGAIARALTGEGVQMGNEILLRAQSGDTDAIRYTAWMYAYGVGGAKANRKEAYKYYRMLAEQGDAEGQTMLGYMTLYGLSGVEDMELGLEMISKAMQQRYSLAYYIMADFLENHVEETEDTKAQAQMYYEIAEKLGK